VNFFKKLFHREKEKINLVAYASLKLIIHTLQGETIFLCGYKRLSSGKHRPKIPEMLKMLYETRNLDHTTEITFIRFISSGS
jgi:hypothetical protein